MTIAGGDSSCFPQIPSGGVSTLRRCDWRYRGTEKRQRAAKVIAGYNAGEYGEIG
jgi:hypothetical protein